MCSRHKTHHGPSWRPAFVPPPGYQGRPGSFYHDLKNLLVEWVRSSPQRSAKGLAFLAVLGWAFGLVQGLVLAW